MVSISYFHPSLEGDLTKETTPLVSFQQPHDGTKDLVISADWTRDEFAKFQHSSFIHKYFGLQNTLLILSNPSGNTYDLTARILRNAKHDSFNRWCGESAVHSLRGSESTTSSTVPGHWNTPSGKANCC